MDIIQELYKRIEEQNLWESQISIKRNAYLKNPGPSIQGCSTLFQEA